MLFALSTAHEIGLAVCGGLFITFALLSSFYFPSRDPNFPGQKGLRWYIPLCCVFFVGMLGAVFYFGQEKPEAEAALPAQTTTTGGSGASTTPAAKGDPAAGKVLFTTNGCGACHTYGPAGSTGKVGPPLDELADYAQKAGQPVDEFAHGAIVNPPPKYVPPPYPKNVMPATYGKTLTPDQVDNLVAFLTAPK
jgi:mono/diheme cytochrome c family protein